jgi:hypothetical protein
MASDELRDEALKVWFEYGEAIKEAWNFPKKSVIAAEGLPQMLADGTDEKVRKFIAYYRAQTSDIQSMKFAGT